MKRPSLEQVERWLRELLGHDGPAPRDELLASYVAGHLGAAETAAMERHIGGCLACLQALDDYEATASCWQDDGADSPGVLRRSRRRAYQLSLAVAAAAALLLVVWQVARPPDVVPGVTPPPPGGAATRTLQLKGGFSLHPAVRRGDHTWRLRSGEHLEDGDAMGFFYTASEDGYVVVLYGDGAGTFTPLYPTGTETAAPIRAGVEAPLPAGATITPPTPAAVPCEWVVALYSRSPLRIPDGIDLAERAWHNRRGCFLEFARQTTRIEIMVFEVTR